MEPIGTSDFWKRESLKTKLPILAFYTDNPKRMYNCYGYKPEYSCFSNFYNNEFTLNFTLPDQYLLEVLEISPWFISIHNTSIQIENSEKGIMLWKAILMGDKPIFDQILKKTNPSEIKRLGRNVSNWNEDRWNRWKEFIALNILEQKFKDPKLKTILANTGDNILVEATKNDTIWAIGLDIEDPNVQNPRKHKGTNLLGATLMQIRSTF